MDYCRIVNLSRSHSFENQDYFPYDTNPASHPSPCGLMAVLTLEQFKTSLSVILNEDYRRMDPLLLELPRGEPSQISERCPQS